MSSVLIVGHTDPSRLESSYANAFTQLGWSVSRWNPDTEMLASVRGGRVGQMLTAFVAVEPWVRKMNRKLVLDAMNLRPNLVLVFASAPVRVGALAQLRASVDCSLVLVWPDTLVNWDTHLTAALPLYDLVASYSQRTVDLLTPVSYTHLTLPTN